MFYIKENAILLRELVIYCLANWKHSYVKNKKKQEWNESEIKEENGSSFKKKRAK